MGKIVNFTLETNQLKQELLQINQEIKVSTKIIKILSNKDNFKDNSQIQTNNNMGKWAKINKDHTNNNKGNNNNMGNNNNLGSLMDNSL